METAIQPPNVEFLPKVGYGGLQSYVTLIGIVEDSHKSALKVNEARRHLSLPELPNSRIYRFLVHNDNDPTGKEIRPFTYLAVQLTHLHVDMDVRGSTFVRQNYNGYGYLLYYEDMERYAMPDIYGWHREQGFPTQPLKEPIKPLVSELRRTTQEGDWRQYVLSVDAFRELVFDTFSEEDLAQLSERIDPRKVDPLHGDWRVLGRRILNTPD